MKALNLKLSAIISRIRVKKEILISIFSSLLILLFVYTALSKLMQYNDFRFVLKRSPLVENWSEYLAWLVPSTELLISLFLLFPKTKRLGFLSSTILMASFTLYVGYMIAFIPDKPCGCGGIMRELDWNQHLFVNALFTIMAFLGYRFMRIKRA